MNNTTVILAYLDPGTGSLILQAVLGGVVGAAVVIKLYWRRFLSFIRFKKSSDHASSED